MRKTAEGTDVTYNRVLGQVGRAMIQVAEWYAGCSGHPLAGVEAYTPGAADEPPARRPRSPEGRHN